MRRSKWWAVWLFLQVVVFTPGVWAGEATSPAPRVGTVLRIEGERVYASLGAADGIRPGQRLKVLETVSAVDPAGGATLVDHFSLGSAVVVEVGVKLCLVQVEGGALARLEVGDIVRFEADQLTVEAASVAPTTPSAAEPAWSEDFRRTFAEATGVGVAERRQVWTRYLERWPAAPTSDAVRAELQQLLGTVQPAAPPALTLNTAAPLTALEDHPVLVSVTVTEVDRLAAAMLFYRRQGEPTYRYTPMQAIGDTVFQAAVPEDAVVRPAVEWYVSAEDRAGRERHAGGSPTQPATISVTPELPTSPQVQRSQVGVRYEFVDFYQLKGVDQYSHLEADYLYRRDPRDRLYGVRVGYGVYQGVSGVTSELAAATPEEYPSLVSPVGFRYGYTEFEVKLHRNVSLLTRGIAGVQSTGLAFGGHASLRVGPEDGVNLMATAANVGSLGNFYAIALAWNTIERVPMGAAVNVTNQPGGHLSGYGVRLVYDARFQIKPWLAIGGRVGYQLRNIDYAGPTFGTAVVLSW